MDTMDWHGFEGHVLENDALRVVVIPALGAKIASLADKAAGHEWLAPPSRPVRAREYGDSFIAHDLAGWDEMFPTIISCQSPHDPAEQLPDHGEVWALPWHLLDDAGDGLTLRVGGRALSYVLTRTAALEGSALRLDYHLKSLSDAPIPFVWAAHPLFNADAETRIVLPDGVTQVVNVAEHSVWGASDRRLPYPALTGTDIRLDRARDPAHRDYRKYYLPPEQPVAGAALVQEDLGCALHLSWDVRVAPYLGVWIDEGTYSRGTTVALEPASGYYDSLSLAMANQRVAVLPPGETIRWWLSAACAGTATK